MRHASSIPFTFLPWCVFVTGSSPPPGNGMKVSDTGLDGFEIGLLAILRHFCTSFCTPHSQAWMTAYGIATERWGVSNGPKAAQSLLAVAEAMRRARPKRVQTSRSCPFPMPSKSSWRLPNVAPKNC